MALISLAQGLAHAQQHGYALGAFNVLDTHFLRALFHAAEQQRSPFIINIAEVHFKYVSLEPLIAAIRAEAALHAIPVVLNLDHGLHFDAVMQAIRLGFTSVMFDGSTLSYDENIRQTREVVKMCHALGISVEAELGAVGGDEGARCLAKRTAINSPTRRWRRNLSRQPASTASPWPSATRTANTKASQSLILTVWRRFAQRPAFRWCCTAVPASATPISAAPSASASTKSTFTPVCRRRRSRRLKRKSPSATRATTRSPNC